MEKLTSAHNPVVRRAAAVRRDASVRRAESLCFAEGLRLCREAAAAGRVETAFFTADFMAKFPDETAAIAAGAACYGIDGGALTALGDTRSPQGVFCICRTAGLIGEAETLPPGRYLCLEHIADPGNLGGMLRTAEAFGVDGVVLSAGCCDLFSPKVLRASMGGVFRMKPVVCADLPGLLTDLRAHGFACYAAMPDAAAQPIQTLRPADSFLAVVGNEANGVTPETAALCLPVTIPMAGGAESLNAAAAATVLLWELFGRHCDE